MQRIFTEENAQQRQQNISELTSTLKSKHEEVKNQDSSNLDASDQRILRSIHEMSKETKNELKEMRKALDKERKLNVELRDKVKRKNRQLKTLSVQQQESMGKNENKKNNEVEQHSIMIGDGVIGSFPPMAYGDVTNYTTTSRTVRSTDSIETDYSVTDDQPSTFQNWCVNMGFSTKTTKCSWF
eukprot:341718_1